MQSASQELDRLVTEVASGAEPEITGRQLLSWFGASRRGWRVVERIRKELEARQLVTDPDFNEVWVDDPLRVKKVSAEPDAFTSSEEPAPKSGGQEESGSGDGEAGRPREASDPIHRLGQLLAANKEVTTVSQGTALIDATTVMMMNDYSQLPVMQGERSLKGAISWQSIAAALALGRECTVVDDCMIPADDVPLLQASVSLFDAIPKIAKAGFALIRARDHRLQGIVTAVDLSLQFRDLSEPFLLLGQIERFVRGLVGRTFTIDELKTAKNSADEGREIASENDLSFGEYLRLISPEASWERLGLPVSRKVFLKHLDRARELRNDVMHFDPDPLGAEDIAFLRNFVVFLERLRVSSKPK